MYIIELWLPSWPKLLTVFYTCNYTGWVELGKSRKGCVPQLSLKEDRKEINFSKEETEVRK